MKLAKHGLSFSFLLLSSAAIAQQGCAPGMICGPGWTMPNPAAACGMMGCPVEAAPAPAPWEQYMYPRPAKPYYPKGVVALASNGKVGSSIEVNYEHKWLKKSWEQLTAEAIADCQSAGGQDCRVAHKFKNVFLAVAEPTGNERPDFASFSSGGGSDVMQSAIEECQETTRLECDVVLFHNAYDDKQERFTKSAHQIYKDPFRMFMTLKREDFSSVFQADYKAGKSSRESALAGYRTVMGDIYFPKVEQGEQPGAQRREFEANYTAAFNALVDGGMAPDAAGKKLFYDITGAKPPQ